MILGTDEGNIQKNDINTQNVVCKRFVLSMENVLRSTSICQLYAVFFLFFFALLFLYFYFTEILVCLHSRVSVFITTCLCIVIQVDFTYINPNQSIATVESCLMKMLFLFVFQQIKGLIFKQKNQFRPFETKLIVFHLVLIISFISFLYIHLNSNPNCILHTE